MFNRVDKCFFISTIVILILLVVSFLLIATIPLYENNVFLEMLFGTPILITILLIPISIVEYIIIFLIKIFSKNKIQKDWIIILADFILIIILCTILYVLFIALSHPLLWFYYFLCLGFKSLKVIYKSSPDFKVIWMFVNLFIL